jgi:hypothetical protein
MQRHFETEHSQDRANQPKSLRWRYDDRGFMPSTLETFEVFPGIANGALDRLYLHHATMSHTLPAADAFDRGLRRMQRQFGRQYLILFSSQLTRASAPSEEVRTRFVTTLRNPTILPCAAALAIMSPGLIGATGRSIVTGIVMAVRLPFHLRVFGTVSEAYQFLSKEAQREAVALPSFTTVEAAVETLEARGQQASK